MAANKSWLRRSAQRLADRLDRLRDNLDALRERLREAVAQSIGQAVAGAVHDAVQAALGQPDSGSHRPYTQRWDHADPQHWNRSERPDYWQEPQNAMWQEEPDDSWQEGSEDETFPATTPSPEPQSKKLTQAVALGCETAAWWLRRWPDRLAILTAAGLGLAASMMAWSNGSLTIAGLSLAQSLASLVSLSDTLQAGTSVLAPFGHS